MQRKSRNSSFPAPPPGLKLPVPANERAPLSSRATAWFHPSSRPATLRQEESAFAYRDLAAFGVFWSRPPLFFYSSLQIVRLPSTTRCPGSIKITSELLIKPSTFLQISSRPPWFSFPPSDLPFLRKLSFRRRWKTN